MALGAFIEQHHDEIIREFTAFAKTLMPTGANMTEAELADHAAEMLTAVVEDMRLAQSAAEQSRKSQGRGYAKTMEVSGKLHADDRIHHGFTFRAVLAEFRALRATVLRLYEDSGDSDLLDVRRFNEAIDEALTASMDRFAARTDLFRDQFVGVLSHDLRTPLGAISAGAAMLAVPEDNPQRRSRVVTRIMNSAQRMARMIDDLLDVTRERLGGSMVLKRRPADLVQVCEDAILEVRAAQPEAVVSFHPNGDLRGEWDPDRLAQVLANLLSNAVQHGRGSPITLTAHENGDAVMLSVHNGGGTIPPDVLPSVFEPLVRGDVESPGRGIGLGLFIARAVVSAHGGDIQVTSTAEAGTTFTVTLPRAAAALIG